MSNYKQPRQLSFIEAYGPTIQSIGENVAEGFVNLVKSPRAQLYALLSFLTTTVGCGESYLNRNIIKEGLTLNQVVDGRIVTDHKGYVGDNLAIPLRDIDVSRLGHSELSIVQVEGLGIGEGIIYGKRSIIVDPTKPGNFTISYKGNYSNGEAFEGSIKLSVPEETPSQRAARIAFYNATYKTGGVVGTIVTPAGDIVIPKPGDIFFSGEIVDPTDVRLNEQGYQEAAKMDADYAGKRALEDLFGKGSSRGFIDKYGVVHFTSNVGMGDVLGRMVKLDMLAPFKAIGNSAENASLGLEKSVQLVWQSMTNDEGDAAKIAKTSDGLCRIIIAGESYLPLTGDGWRRVHSFVDSSGKMHAPLLGYIEVDEFPMHTNAAKVSGNPMLNYNEDFSNLNPDWAVRLDNSTKTWEICGAIGGGDVGVGYYLIIKPAANHGGSSSSSAGSSAPGPVPGTPPPTWP